MNETIAMVNEVPLRDEVYYRMLSTDIDERVELLWCGVQYYSSIWIATTLAKRERGIEWFHLGEVGDLRDIIIVTHHHHHSSVSYASMPVSDIKPPKTTSNRDHIRCKEMSVVNHDGYPPSCRLS